MRTRFTGKGVRTCALWLAALSWGCQDDLDPAGPEAPAPAAAKAEAPAPAPLVTVGFAGESLTFWPFLGAEIGGEPRDPVNLLFPGRPDARQLRAALVMLDGDRSAFGLPAQAPFDCTWKEAVGANQVGWAEGEGWTASAIQLECGDFGPIRFHVRFFPAGDWTLANAHFEVLIPGTNDHRVLSWELGEQLVAIDLMRSGLLDPSAPAGSSGPINPAPSWKTIEPAIYNGLPAALKVLLTGSPANVSAPVGAATDGQATILNLAGEAEGERTVAVRDFDLPFNQMIPKPFCAAGPADWILVQGTIRFRQRVVLTPSGNFLSHFHATGSLDITPMNPLTSPPTPVGETYRAQINEHYRNIVTDNVTQVASLSLQVLLPPSAPVGGRLHGSLHFGPGGVEATELSVRCGG